MARPTSIDADLLHNLLVKLVSINSVNPTLVPGARGEFEAAGCIWSFLGDRDIAVDFEVAVMGRSNVVARLGPQGVQPALMILAHLDTVGAGDMPDPFKPHERGGHLYGRGALDIKSGVAAMCVAAVAARQLHLRRPALIAGVVDEECNSIGTEALIAAGHRADAAVVLEPTDLKLVVAHKGYTWLEITTHGRSAHGSLPSEGRDAIRRMGRVLLALDAHERRIAERGGHPRLGHASLHASLIQGGQELSSYPSECHLQLERRTLPGETDESVAAELFALLEVLRSEDPEFSAEIRPLGSRPAYEISPEAPIARAAAKAIRTVTGSVELAGMAAWTDTALLNAAGIPGVVFGPRGRGMHGAEEYVELDSVKICAQVLLEMIRAHCT